tara:strand:- start:464 stop:601 length:138 start_codon:yes stop_codon:yes gene_type:complete
MQQRNKSDRRDNDRRIQNSPVQVNRRTTERRSGADRRVMLSGATA